MTVDIVNVQACDSLAYDVSLQSFHFRCFRAMTYAYYTYEGYTMMKLSAISFI